MTAIQPLIQTFPIINPDGTASKEFKAYMDQILTRVGGVTGGSYQALSFQPSVVWDPDQNPVAFIVLTGNTTFASPAAMVAGLIYRLTIIQDAVGGRTITWGSAYKFPGGTPPTLTAAPNAVDELWFSCDGTNMKCITGAGDLK